ncbi:MAG: hypothetical protein H0U61_00020 [Nocardioidaceae bacterium]|nr:hypothetical protein [Nocardioidaceae bacterium]
MGLLVAMERADVGALIADIVEVQGSGDGRMLADIVRGWTAAQLGSVRRTFLSVSLVAARHLATRFA